MVRDGLLIQGDGAKLDFHFHLNGDRLNQAEFVSHTQVGLLDEVRAGVEKWLDAFFAQRGFSGRTESLADTRTIEQTSDIGRTFRTRYPRASPSQFCVPPVVQPFNINDSLKFCDPNDTELR